MAGDISRKTGQWKVMARQKKNKEEKDEKKSTWRRYYWCRSSKSSFILVKNSQLEPRAERERKKENARNNLDKKEKNEKLSLRVRERRNPPQKSRAMQCSQLFTIKKSETFFPPSFNRIILSYFIFFTFKKIRQKKKKERRKCRALTWIELKLKKRSTSGLCWDVEI